MQARRAERRFVVRDDLGGRQRHDDFLAGLREVGERGFIDIEGNALAQAEVDQRTPLFFLVGQGIEIEHGDADAVIGQYQGGAAPPTSRGRGSQFAAQRRRTRRDPECSLSRARARSRLASEAAC